MRIAKKLAAAAVALAMVSVNAVSSTTLAADNSATLHNTTNSAESKVQNTEKPFQVFDIYNAYRELNKPASAPHDRLPAGQYKVGIDVSEHQGYIDWYRVKNSGQVDFAIIRAGYGKEYYQKDKRFDENVRNIQAAGLDYGIYWYSYALDVESAKKEAEVCMSMLDGYSFNYPVYFDIEEASQRDRLSVAEFSAVVDTFCSTLEENGYFAGIYSCGSMLETKLYKNILEKYDVWVAEYDGPVKIFTGEYGIWQYSSTGIIDGISTIVDMNYCYRDYPSIVGVNPSTGTLPTAVKPTGSPTAGVVPVSNGARSGIRLSDANGEVNWLKLKNSGVSFAMIKAADSGSKSAVPFIDKSYYTNMEGAQKNGLNVGIYWHAQTLSAEKMAADAEWFNTILYTAKPEYPVFLDLTDEVYATSDISGKELSELVEAFCSILEENKFYVGLYATEELLNSLDPELLKKYDIWLSLKAGEIPMTNFDGGITGISGIMVPGISGEVEVLCATMNYPAIMKDAHLNGF